MTRTVAETIMGGEVLIMKNSKIIVLAGLSLILSAVSLVAFANDADDYKGKWEASPSRHEQHMRDHRHKRAKAHSASELKGAIFQAEWAKIRLEELRKVALDARRREDIAPTQEKNPDKASGEQLENAYQEVSANIRRSQEITKVILSIDEAIADCDEAIAKAKEWLEKIEHEDKNQNQDLHE